MKCREYNRKDPRPIPKKNKKPIPEWAEIKNRDNLLPVWMYITPTAEEMEEVLNNDGEIKYKKIKVRNTPIVETTAHINLP